MTEERVAERLNVDPEDTAKVQPKTRKNLVHFTGEKPVVINLDHVTTMRLEGKTIYFDFYSKTQPVDFLDEEGAKSVLQALMNLWAGDNVVE